MKRVGFLLKVKEDRIEEYKKHHEAVWPEMLTAIQESGMRNYSLFLADGGKIIGYFEAEDPEKSIGKLGQTDVNGRWQQHVAEYFEGGSGDLGEGGLQWLEQYFHVE